MLSRGVLQTHSQLSSRRHAAGEQSGFGKGVASRCSAAPDASRVGGRKGWSGQPDNCSSSEDSHTLQPFLAAGARAVPRPLYSSVTIVRRRHHYLQQQHSRPLRPVTAFDSNTPANSRTSREPVHITPRDMSSTRDGSSGGQEGTGVSSSPIRIEALQGISIRRLNSVLKDANSLSELEQVEQQCGDMFDFIHISTAFARCGHLASSAAIQPTSFHPLL